MPAFVGAGMVVAGYHAGNPTRWQAPGALLDGQETVLGREQARGSAARDADLRVDVLDVIADGLGRDV